jgi:hypothetical protein
LIKLKENNIISIWRSIFTEGKDNISLGSICLAVIIPAWVFHLIWVTIYNRSLLISGTQMAALVGSIYGPKKAVSLFNSWKGGKSK